MTKKSVLDMTIQEAMELASDRVAVGAPPIKLKQREDTSESSATRKSDRSFTLVLFAMVVLSLLLVFMLGVNVYKSLTQSREENGNLRQEQSLVTTLIRSVDEMDGASAGTGPEGSSLVLTEHFNNTAFETRFYLYKGYLCEEYAAAANAYSPELAAKIAKTSVFSFNINEDTGLLSITTDAGTAYIALRSSQQTLAAAQGSAATADAASAAGATAASNASASTNAQAEGGELDG